ncbi:MAG: pantoate--beta-alanine ligase [Oleibacter sp.]|nr:pantoate--beta-alanine ligase [Thalassolituus sp.]
MITQHTVEALRARVNEARTRGLKIGFVPTMGNLHKGHISLIDRAKAECDFVVSSIFVNPLQFNDASDLERYPRTLPEDQAKLEAASCDLLFAPNVAEMYPNGRDEHTIVHVPKVSEGLCGGSRPGHFDGVSTVVMKLFNQVNADVAYFGEKDFQQVAVIKKMVADLSMAISIVTVPTARADDGLALSSRNGYLTPTERAIAPGLYQALQGIAKALQDGISMPKSIANATLQLNQQGFRCDYLEVRRASDLAPAIAGDQDVVVIGAAYLGNARLIDNLITRLNRVID